MTEATTMPESTATEAEREDLAFALGAFRRALEAENLSPNTLDAYCGAVERYLAFAEGNGLPRSLRAISREHIELWLAEILRTQKPATAHNRFRGMQRLCNWLVEQGELRRSPMERMHPPRLPEQPVPVLADDALRALLAVVERDKTFRGRRDRALLRLMIDTGCRRAEAANLRWTPEDTETNDVDVDGGVIRIRGKGGYVRFVALARKTRRVLDDYLLLRRRHPLADLSALWLTGRGPLTPSGVGQMVKERAREAGIQAHTHQLRHSMAHAWLAAGGQEADLMRTLGWHSPVMVRRYASSTAQSRAIAAQRRLGLADRL